MKEILKNKCMAMAVCLCITANLFAADNHLNNDSMEKNLNLTEEWDKVFPQSDKVNHTKVIFHNRYGITLAADLYIPKNAGGKLPAIDNPSEIGEHRKVMGPRLLRQGHMSRFCNLPCVVH